MAKLVKYSDDMLGWKRNPSPLKVWGVVSGRKKSPDGKYPRFSIQEVPEDRFEDVLHLMCRLFVSDEPVCQYLKAIEDPVAIEDLCKLWSLPLQKGLVTGAFLVDGENSRPVLAGVNMTLVACKTSDETLHSRINFRSVSVNKLLRMMHDLETEKDTREIYEVDHFITAYGLCVDSKFRGQGLGFQLLQARDKIAVAYDIGATSTVFTSVFAQKNAAQAGFEELLERNFVDVRNEDGTEMFPGIPHKSVKLMGKKLQH